MLNVISHTVKSVKSKVLHELHGPIGWHWSPFPVAQSRTPAETAGPQIRG